MIVWGSCMALCHLFWCFFWSVVGMDGICCFVIFGGRWLWMELEKKKIFVLFFCSWIEWCLELLICDFANVDFDPVLWWLVDHVMRWIEKTYLSCLILANRSWELGLIWWSCGSLCHFWWWAVCFLFFFLLWGFSGRSNDISVGSFFVW